MQIDLKLLNVLQYFLGIDIERDDEVGDITLSQKQYIRDLLKTYGMYKSKSVAMPLEAGYQIACKEDCSKADVTQYQSLLGSLMYLGITTRPDIECSPRGCIFATIVEINRFLEKFGNQAR